MKSKVIGKLIEVQREKENGVKIFIFESEDKKYKLLLSSNRYTINREQLEINKLYSINIYTNMRKYTNKNGIELIANNIHISSFEEIEE